MILKELYEIRPPITIPSFIFFHISFIFKYFRALAWHFTPFFTPSAIKLYRLIMTYMKFLYSLTPFTPLSELFFLLDISSAKVCGFLRHLRHLDGVFFKLQHFFGFFLICHMHIQVHSNIDARMPEDLLESLRPHTRLYTSCGEGMPERMH